MAEQFVVTTYCWSPYFLNDTPSSRRPWLFRKEYNTIDSILSKHPATHYEDRRHPEEFASAFLINMMRGTWSIPQRNATFTGRDLELSQIHARLIAQKAGQNHHTGVAKVEITGMGGVGKTQLCTEYCYRNFPSYYGLVIWLSAQGAERIVACYRQLLADTTGVDARDKDTEEVISEVKARLFRSKVPWLLVFDNLEDRSLLQKFVPHGGSCGHLLVTTRSLGADDNDQSTMILGCFSPSESIQLLCRSANISGEIHVKAAHHLAGQLGHLPLALSMAAAYMLRCDVDCSEYLARYADSERNGALLGHQVVESSLALSLNAIKRKSVSLGVAPPLLAGS
ncbi:NB-ARC domain [Fragilaria crotonensis]|nr:NB-ARC domain [Fragilaria crotonensis]